MTVRTTALQNSAAGLPAEELRLMTATFVPATGGLHNYSGVLPAASGYMGEVTLLTPETVRVNPARWVIAGTQAGTQGDYVVTNDAPVERPIGARDATLTRLDRLVVQARDTAYVPNDGVDAPDVRVIPGTPALTGAALPALPVNALQLGTFTVPPGSGTVTFTPTVVPQQVAVGGIAPTRTGETLANGAYDGQFQDHSAWGLRRWSTVSGTWDDVIIDRIRTLNATDVSPTSTGHPFQLGPDNAPNLAMDPNQILARDNGKAAYLGINGEADTDGHYGNVSAGPASTFYGDLPSTDYRHRSLEVERLRIASTSDASAAATPGGAASVLHGLQIGPSTGVHVIMDNNEMIPRNADSTLASFVVQGLQVTEPTLDSQPVRRGNLNGDSGLANQTAWQSMSLNSKFAAISGGPGAKWIYRNGVIRFTLAISAATAWSSGQVIITWSATWKPRYDTYFVALTSGLPWGQVAIDSATGNMTIQPAGAAGAGFVASGSFIPISVA